MTDPTFRKVGEPETIRIEMAKTAAAAAIGEASGLFYVPAVRGGDPDAGSLYLERLPALLSLTELTNRGDRRLLAAAGQLGRSLAAVHENLRLGPGQALTMPAGWEDWGDDSVYVHGDLTANNVFWDISSDRLVILDWSSAPALGRPVTIADRHFDLAWFCLSVFWRPSWRRRPLYRGGAICEAFLASYAKASGRFSGPRFRTSNLEQLISAGYGQTHRAVSSRLAQRLRRARWQVWLRTSPVLRDSK